MGYGNAKPGFIVLICGILGLCFAAVEQLAWDHGWYSQLWWEAADLLGLQILTIVLMLIIGGILAAISCK